MCTKALENRNQSISTVLEHVPKKIVKKNIRKKLRTDCGDE